MNPGQIEPLPKVPNQGILEEHGISIPAPTPTGVSIPNPWGPPEQMVQQAGNPVQQAPLFGHQPPNPLIAPTHRPK
jgi:hypothetical protein